MENVSFGAAFLGGMLSILSPCMLPLLPGYLAYMAGLSTTEKWLTLNTSQTRWKLFSHAILFSLGFSLIFILVGGVIGYLGELFLTNISFIRQIGGVLLILVGIYTTGILPFQKWQKTYQLKLPKYFEQLDYLKSFALGLIFAFSWSPCYGPIIGSILALVAIDANFWRGIELFSFFSLGFTLPLILMSLSMETITKKIKRHKKALRYFSWAAGCFIIFIGILLLSEKLFILHTWLLELYETFDLPY